MATKMGERVSQLYLDPLSAQMDDRLAGASSIPLGFFT